MAAFSRAKQWLAFGTFSLLVLSTDMMETLRSSTATSTTTAPQKSFALISSRSCLTVWVKYPKLVSMSDFREK